MSSTPVTIISTPGSINVLLKYYLIFGQSSFSIMLDVMPTIMSISHKIQEKMKKSRKENLIFWFQLDVIFYVPKCPKDQALLFRKILELN